jgi:hypothetical protein
VASLVGEAGVGEIATDGKDVRVPGDGGEERLKRAGGRAPEVEVADCGEAKAPTFRCGHYAKEGDAGAASGDPRHNMVRQEGVSSAR